MMSPLTTVDPSVWSVENNVVAVSQQMRGKGVKEGMTGGVPSLGLSYAPLL